MTTLVLLPGMDGSGALFSDFIEALRGELATTVITYPHATPLGYDALQSLVQTQLPPEGELVVLGESFSGPVAVALAEQHPGRVKALVLCCSFAANPRPALRRWAFLAPLLPVQWAPKAAMAALMFGSSSTRALSDALYRAVSSVSPATLRVRLASVATVDRSAQLRKITVPVLYLQAAEDRLVPRKVGDALVQTCADARLISISGPHGLLQAAPEAAAQAICTFVRALALHGTKHSSPSEPLQQQSKNSDGHAL